MGLRGPKKSSERIELEDSHCGACGALPGQSCLTPTGKSQGSKMVHASRQQAFDMKQLAGIRR